MSVLQVASKLTLSNNLVQRLELVDRPPKLSWLTPPPRLDGTAMGQTGVQSIAEALKHKDNAVRQLL